MIEFERIKQIKQAINYLINKRANPNNLPYVRFRFLNKNILQKYSILSTAVTKEYTEKKQIYIRICHNFKTKKSK